MVKRKTAFALVALLLSVVPLHAQVAAPTAPAPPPLNSPAAVQEFNRQMAHQAIQGAYSNTDMIFTTPQFATKVPLTSNDYVEVGPNGKATPQPHDVTRVNLADLSKDYSHVNIEVSVDAFSLDAAGGATAQVRERRTLQIEAMGRNGTQIDMACRDYLIPDGGSWRLTRRRILSIQRSSVYGTTWLRPLPPELSAAEKADPVFGPDAPQTVHCYRFFPYFFTGSPQIGVQGSDHKAQQTVPMGKSAAFYAQVAASLFSRIGVKNKCIQDKVYIVVPPNSAAGCSSQVGYELKIIRP